MIQAHESLYPHGTVSRLWTSGDRVPWGGGVGPVRGGLCALDHAVMSSVAATVAVGMVVSWAMVLSPRWPGRWSAIRPEPK